MKQPEDQMQGQSPDVDISQESHQGLETVQLTTTSGSPSDNMALAAKETMTADVSTDQTGKLADTINAGDGPGPATDCDKTLMQGTVLFQGEERVLLLNSRGINLLPATNSPPKNAKKHLNEAFDIPWQYTITAERISHGQGSKNGSNDFLLYYIQQREKLLRTQCLKMTCQDDIIDAFINVIRQQSDQVAGRPRKLFAIVNPIGGKRNAGQIFQKKVLSIMQLAKIQMDSIFTERSKHALEIGEHQDFSSYDGVVVIGGDGLYQEVVQGLTIQQQKSAGVDFNDVNATFAPLTKPIAVIPAGTGNGLTGWINGIIDVETATLRILLGETHRGPVFTVHSNNRFVCLGGIVFGYGMFSDFIKRSDELRWMRKARYLYVMGSSFIKKKRLTHLSLEYCLAADSVDKSTLSTKDSSRDHRADRQWIHHDSKGRDYAGIFNFVANFTGKEGHHFFFTDRFRLYIDTGCSNFGLAKCMVDYFKSKKTQTLPAHLEVLDDVQGIRIKSLREDMGSDAAMTGATARAIDLEHYLDIDGESLKLDVPDLELHFVPSFVPLYSMKSL